MKKIIVATDFSPAAENAARYALHLAYHLQVNVELLHGFEIPLISSKLTGFDGSVEQYQELKSAKLNQLNDLVAELDQQGREARPELPWIPQITYRCEEGEVFQLIAEQKSKKDMLLLTVGTSSIDGINRFLFGSKVRRAIDQTGLPVLVVPPLADFAPIRRIAFAADFGTNDLELLHALSGLARSFNAEILIAHVTKGNAVPLARQKKIDTFLKDVTAKANYPKIYYRHLSGMNVEQGLTWLVEHGNIDLLVMVHRPHDLFDQIFKGSHTMKIVDRTTLPTLIFTDSVSLAGFMSGCL